MVVAGCAEGEMALWDLRETSATHHQLREEDEEGVLRRAPTYVSQGSHASKVLYFISLSFSPFHIFQVVSVRHLQDGEGAPTPVSDKGGLANFHLPSMSLSSPRSGCVSAGVSGEPGKSRCVDGARYSERF